LVVDVGGTHVKLLATGKRTPIRIDSGPRLTPRETVREVLAAVATAHWQFDRVSLGFPGPVRQGSPQREPWNLGKGWVGFNFARAFGCPVRVINDAAMQALGSYDGGKMLPRARHRSRKRDRLRGYRAPARARASPLSTQQVVRGVCRRGRQEAARQASLEKACARDHRHVRRGTRRRLRRPRRRERQRHEDRPALRPHRRQPQCVPRRLSIVGHIADSLPHDSPALSFVRMTVDRLTLPAVVLAVGVALAGLLAGNGFARARAGDRFVAVKGVSEREVRADLAIWPLHLVGADNDLAAANAKLTKRDRKSVV